MGQKLNPKLEKAVEDLLKNIRDLPELDDKLKVIDRALKLEQVKAKFQDEEFGSGFVDE